MKMVTVKLQGVEVQAALLSPDIMKRFEGKKENVAGSVAIRRQCQAVIDYVVEIFGEDAAKRVFGAETDLLTCLDVLEEMQQLYPDQVSPFIRQKNEALKARIKKSEE